MPEDPVVKSGRREALFTLGVWLAAASYTITYCTLHGYRRAPEDIRFVLWFPDWIFWGIVVPWLACTVVSCSFALWGMQDAPLTSDADAPSDGGSPDDTASNDPASNDPGPAAAAPMPGGRP